LSYYKIRHWMDYAKLSHLDGKWKSDKAPLIQATTKLNQATQ